MDRSAACRRSPPFGTGLQLADALRESVTSLQLADALRESVISLQLADATAYKRSLQSGDVADFPCKVLLERMFNL